MKLYQLAYACRLYQGQYDTTYRDMRKDLGDDPNMDFPHRLLQFLNKWGCRIAKEKLGILEEGLKEWAGRWIRQLPQASRNILSLTTNEIELAEDHSTNC